MGVFEIGSSEVGGPDEVGGTVSLLPPPEDPPPPDPPPTDPVITIPTTPPEWAFLDMPVHTPVNYTFVVGGNTPGYELPFILDPSMSFALKDTCKVSFNLNELDPLAQKIAELQTDLWVFRNRELIFRGRVGPSQDTLDGDSGYVSFTAFDYRGVLKRRSIYDDDIYFWYDEDIAVIAKNCLDAVQGRTGGNLGITTGIGFPTLGVVRNEVEFTPGTSVASGLDSLQESKLRGFDWEVSPELELNLWAQRGIAPAVRHIEYNGAIKNLTRDYKTDEFANAARASGGEIPEPIILEDPNVGTDERGRWEAEVSWPDVETQEILEDRTEYLLEQVNRVPEEYSVDLREGHWQGPSSLWLGDETILVVNFGRLGESKTVRVHEITLSPDGDGGEQVKATLK